MYQTRCQNCFQVQRIEYEGVTLVSEKPRFCAYCGSDQIKPTKVDSYWYDLSESLGFTRDAESAALIHKLYGLWERSEYRHFRSFVEATMKEAAE